MSSPMPDDLGTRGTESMAMENHAERSANVMSSGSQAMEGESSEAIQAKMEAQKYAKLFREASLRYARLAPQANLRSQSLHNKMKLAAYSGATAEEKSIYRTGLAIGLSTITNQLRSSIPQDKTVNRVGSAAISLVPLSVLPARHGSSEFENVISHPAVWGTAAVAVIASTREILEKMGKGRKPVKGSGPILPAIRQKVKKLRDGYRPRVTNSGPRELGQTIDERLDNLFRLLTEGKIDDKEYATQRERLLNEV